ncbi:MAG TPA: phosphatidylinositol mannoside acyltransferase [Acidimicrobiia bacterium]|nr:phosphatidylinositol mannoside acyltransferase [Acidimicrobiia bacterium]
MSPRLPSRTSYFAYRGAEAVARAVPPAIGTPLARGVAHLAPAVMGERRAQVERNLRRIHGADYDPAALRRDVAATFDSYGRYFYELFRLSTRTPEWINEHFHCTGIEHVWAGVHEGTGAVLALPHLGNWDFAGAWLALQGFDVAVVAEPVEPPELFEWFVETRGRLGMRVIPLSPSAATDVLKALRNNEVVCLLADRDLTGDGVDVEFFGERTTLPGGPAMAALRAGAPLLPVGCYFLPDGDSRADIRPPLDTSRSRARGTSGSGASGTSQSRASGTARTGRLRDDMARVTQDLAHAYEDLIRVAPTHWHLLQPNWPSDRPDRARSDPAVDDLRMG